MRILQFKVAGQNLSKDGETSLVLWPEQRDTCIQNIISIQNGTVAGKRPSSADTKKNILSRS